MLVLSRKPGEEIVIAGNIRITVVSVRGEQVRLGIEAPRNVAVDRQEVHDRRLQFQDKPPAGRTTGNIMNDAASL
jgi:carbon storage regulator